ncbi:hypothetical protein A2Z00_00385 [Candidatus Gottesmanbacteria bacterium RBG_13_45_10]|uniref:Uncharacterized protein n=1 Tax=Candidatus Gottesmanbacteria bacterium RBG_13_45_10 TaxID=1798370 RepID=A0A1F5ZG59_9BACT|nr:MAG: hypothetical protein A2Z00_00385 [Candidatus Gottesmanbacteria bacterium RBG_13_45_10]
MTKIRHSPVEKRIERNFQELKRRSEIRKRYGVFTQGMLEDMFDKKFEEKLGPITKKLQVVDEKLDWLIAEYKKFDEEQILLGHRVGNHDDRIEHIEKKLQIVID